MSMGTLPITNFTAGEWSPKLSGRVDISRYSQACSELLNMTLAPHGAVTRRMGTEYIATAPSSTVRLIPFIFNTEQAYVVEVTPYKLRFFRAGGYLAGKDVATPWGADVIARLAFCQSADTMYFVLPSAPPHKLTRPGSDTFTLAQVAFTGKPAAWQGDSWPGSITFYQQRLWFGGSWNHPQTIWSSKTGSFEDLTNGTEEADGMTISLVSEQVNAIRWLMGQKALLVGTTGGEWSISGDGGALTSKSIQATRNSNYGSATIQPILTGASVLYVSADSRRVRDLAYSFGDDAYLSQDISLLAEHLTRTGIADMAYCQNPDDIIWCVLKGGSMAGCTYMRSQEVIGWHRHSTQGNVVAVTCVPAAGYTETWLAVQRKNGVFIERMKAPWDGETTNEAGCWYVDAGLMYEGSAVTGLSGLEHLEGHTVQVLADGATHENCVVTAGKIKLDVPAKRVLVGLPYTWRVAPMRLEGLSERGTMQGKRIRITEIMVRMYKTLGLLYAWAGQTEEPYEAHNRDVDMAMDTAPLPYTGDTTFPLPGGWGTDSRVILSGDSAFPATISMMVPKAVVNE